MSTLSGVGDMLDFMFFDDDSVAPSTGVPMKWHVSTTFDMLTAARETIAKVGAVSFEAEELETALRALAAERGWKVGDLFMALRIATTGKTATPPLLDIFVALGYERTLARLDRGAQRLAGAPPPG
jgi:glutamyl-tRNA synthetase